MKTMYIMAAIAAIAATSCSKTEIENTQSPKEIVFAPEIGKSTRSGPINGTTFPTNDANYHFSIFAFYKPDAGSYDYAHPYINDDKVVYSNSLWKNSTTYYWPSSGSLKFVAYAPWEKVTPTYNETDGLVITDFDDASTIDLMYTDITGDKTSGSVDLTFKHALTQIYFTMVTTQPNVTFTIKRLQVQDAVGKATFKSLPTPVWTLSSDPSWTVTYTPYIGNTLVKSTDAAPQTLGAPIMLIPQPVTGISFKVIYDINIGGVSTQTNKTKVVTLTGADWAPNQRIKYALSITDSDINAITYNPTITDWAAETTGTTN